LDAEHCHNPAMSFDLGILSGTRRLDPDQARDAYGRLARGAKWSSVLAADDRVTQFVASLSARWPDIDSLPKSEVDASPWSGGFEISPAHVLLTMRFSASGALTGAALPFAFGAAFAFALASKIMTYVRFEESSQ